MGLGRWLLSLSVFLMRRLGEMSWCVALCVGVGGVGVIGASFAVRVPFSWLLHSFRGSSYFGPSSWLRKSILMPSHHWLCPGGSVRGVGRPFVGAWAWLTRWTTPSLWICGLLERVQLCMLCPSARMMHTCICLCRIPPAMPYVWKGASGMLHNSPALSLRPGQSASSQLSPYIFLEVRS